MPYLQPFDPWRSGLCSCPPKWSLNPYTGCGHGCAYCYASSFIPRFFEPRPKKDFLKRIDRELHLLPEGALISLSNSSDPYQPLEERFKLTRALLERLLDKKVKLLILTKSDLVLRDLDLLEKIPCVISFTITSKELSNVLERGAPSFEARLSALKELRKRGFRCVVRLDPVIPGINEEEILEVYKEVKNFADHFVLSSYKARPDSLKRLCALFPEKAPLLRELYLKRGEFIQGSRYLTLSKRLELLSPLIFCLKRDAKSFAFCREGLSEYFRQGLCDGSFLLNVPRGTF